MVLRLLLLLCLSPFGLFAQCHITEAYEREQGAHARRVLFKEHSEKEYQYDLHYLRIRWEVSPYVHFIQGGITYHYKITRDSFGVLALDMDSFLLVDSIVQGGKKAAYRFTDSTRLHITLNRVTAKGGSDSFSLYYRGVPRQVYNSFNIGRHATGPILWILSEPYGAKYWFPCKESLRDKWDSTDIFITVPQGNKAGSNGLLVDSFNRDTFVTYHWRHRYPIAFYLVPITVSNYREFSDWIRYANGDSFPILHYVYPQNWDNWQSERVNNAPLMRLFSDRFGRYPFWREKYGNVQFPFGGGMEHQTMSSMLNLGFLLNAHELAHQWFGDKITCGSWQDIWLNEGFATFCEGIAFENLRSGLDYYNWRVAIKNSTLSAPGGSVYRRDTSTVSAIFGARLTYHKSGLVLHMLRRLLGDDAFFAGVRNYLDDPKLAYSHVLTPDLQKHLEAASGRNLDTFFNAWIYGEGYPNFDLRWRQRENELTIELTQSSSVGNGTTYPTPILLRLPHKDGEVFLSVLATKENETFTFSMPHRITQVVPDPYAEAAAKFNVFNLDTLELEKISLYPNPAQNHLIVRVREASLLTAYSLEIYDMRGRLILQRKMQNQPALFLPIHELPGGVYSVRLKAGDILRREKLVVHRE